MRKYFEKRKMDRFIKISKDNMSKALNIEKIKQYIG